MYAVIISIVFTAGCNNLLCKAFCNFVHNSDLKSVFSSVNDKSMTAGSESGYSKKRIYMQKYKMICLIDMN